MNQKVENFMAKTKKWSDEMKLLRSLCNDCGLTEDFKWMHPCYTYNGNNVVIIHGFKEYCALLFHKGVLMADEDKLLIQQTENVQAARQLRFTSLQEVEQLKDTIKAYIFEAIEIEKSGLKVELKKTKEFEMPQEFQTALNENASLKQAFESLTPGRQRGYLLYFSQAKQSKTRIARIEKYTPAILEGKGLKD